MVAVGEFRMCEREQMVRLAIQRGLIVNAELQARELGVADPVILVTAVDALDKVSLGVADPVIVLTAVDALDKAGCQRFAVCVVSYLSLLRGSNAEGWQEDMEDLRRRGGTLVVCINQTGQLLCSIDPDHPQPEGNGWDDKVW